ncbi:hypothetical protein FF38_06934 [Lucilia cuprina]|uniref:Uncharacterized protein n=1 Tax=Lucilia cuprina TaxID=7375 RepID=A0A0L0CCP2_LUCCU|nr:hypothetical protein FF38_06934 [Lucilia cuprina]
MDIKGCRAKVEDSNCNSFKDVLTYIIRSTPTIARLPTLFSRFHMDTLLAVVHLVVVVVAAPATVAYFLLTMAIIINYFCICLLHPHFNISVRLSACLSIHPSNLTMYTLSVSPCIPNSNFQYNLSKNSKIFGSYASFQPRSKPFENSSKLSIILSL